MNQSTLDLTEEPKADQGKNLTQFHFFAEFVVDLRSHESDWEILHTTSIPLQGNMDSDCYFSDCLGEAEIEDFLESPDIEPGVYRMVYGVNANGSGPDYNGEYDSWEEYTLLSQYKFTDDEVKVCWDNTDDDDAEDTGEW